ncbi:hypothetical protein QTP88_029262 [Uroleucon formosanum]
MCKSNPSKPTAGQLVRKHVKVELNSKHNKACMLCGRKEISEKLYGLLYQLDNAVIHHFCLLLSTRSVQNGADNEGIWGFLLKDIKAELARASKKTCFYCKKKGASISCCGEKCPRVFHLPCGLKNGSMHQYFDTFKSFCEKHRITQTTELSGSRKSTSTTCAICTDAVIRSPLPTSIWAPCCKHDAWFHRVCVQDLALNAGYSFKCPLSSTVCLILEYIYHQEFTQKKKKNCRDSSWETVPNAFAELLERPIICIVNTCLCP